MNDVEYEYDDEGNEIAVVDLGPGEFQLDLLPEWKAVLLSDAGEVVSDAVPCWEAKMHWEPGQVRAARVVSYLLYDHVTMLAQVARIDVPMDIGPDNVVDLRVWGNQVVE